MGGINEPGKKKQRMGKVEQEDGSDVYCANCYAAL